MTRIASALDNDPVAHAPPATGRHRIWAIAHENGFVTAESNPRADIDEFVRGDRIVHIEYGPDGCILDILVNGQCLFNRDRSLAARRSRMAADERASRLEGADR
jgi:hypothetical protein